MTASSTATTGRTTRLPAAASITLLALLALAYVPLRLLMESPDLSDGLYSAFYIYGIALQPLFAAIIIGVAVKIGLKESVGRQWLFLGLGVAMFAVGDVLWMVFELFMKIDPYPSAADVFYVAEYFFFLVAIVMAIRAYSGLVKTRTALLASVAVATVGVIAVYLLLLRPYIFPAGVEELGFLGLFVSTLYPVGDIIFMLAPAIALALVVAQLRAGALARPWWLVVAGALVFALADSLYAYADWAGTGVTWIMDVGWIAANLLFAIAALVARDAYRAR